MGLERDICSKEDRIPVPIKFVQQLPMKKAAALIPADAFGEADFEERPKIGYSQNSDTYAICSAVRKKPVRYPAAVRKKPVWYSAADKPPCHPDMVILRIEHNKISIGAAKTKMLSGYFISITAQSKINIPQIRQSKIADFRSSVKSQKKITNILLCARVSQRRTMRSRIFRAAKKTAPCGPKTERIGFSKDAALPICE